MATRIIRYKYQLVNHRRNKYLHQQVDIAALVWNHAVALQRKYYILTGEYIRNNQLTSHLRKLRQRRFLFWQSLPSRTISAIVKRLDRAYQQFFKRVSKGRPAFKRIKSYKSFVVQGNNWRLIDHCKSQFMQIRIFKHTYTFHYSRPLPELGTQAVTIKRTSDGKFWLSFTVKVETPQIKVTTSKIAGFDFGLRTYLTTSDGKTYLSPEFFKSDIKNIRKSSRQLSRKAKGSNNRHHARLQLAREHRIISNKRDDYQWKLAHKLCDRYDILCFEDLNLGGMKRLWGRKVSDLGFANFLRKLEWVAQKRGKRVVYIDRFEPTSKTCSSCGNVQDMPLRERTYRCEYCGLALDRDHNAARNIKQAGERLLQEASKTLSGLAVDGTNTRLKGMVLNNGF